MLIWSQDNILADKIIKSDFVWSKIREDLYSKDEFQLPVIDGIEIRMCLCYGDDLCGAFFFFQKDDKRTHIHTCMIVKGVAREFGDLVVKKVFNETNYETIETYIPSFNKAAKVVSRQCGFKKVGFTEPMIQDGVEYPVEVWELHKCH